MPFQFLISNVSNRKMDILNGTVTIDAVVDDVYKVTFGESKVPETELLKVFRKYDPNFGPITSDEERKARAALTQKVRKNFREDLKREVIEIDPQIQEEYKQQYEGQGIPRQFHPFFRDCKTVDEQRALAKRLGRDGGEELGKLFAERVLSKTDELIDMQYLNGEELVDSYFRNKDLLDMVFEMQQYKDLGYNEEQQRNYDRLFNNMIVLKGLTMRMSVIASNYYADYPCEEFGLRTENMLDFKEDIKALCTKHNKKTEEVSQAYDIPLEPAEDLATSIYTLCGIMAVGFLDQRLKDFIGGYGVKDTASCVWANASGKEYVFSKAIEALDRHELLFVDIPGEGVKVLRNASQGIKTAKPELATDKDIKEYMLRVVEEGVNRVNEANPNFLAKYTGSEQYNQMAAQHQYVTLMVQGVGFPPTSDKDYELFRQAVDALRQTTNTYLEYKKKQGLKEDEDGMLIGRSANERRRLAAAEKTIQLADTLDFLLQYHKEPQKVSESLKQQKAARIEKNNPAVKAPAPKEILYAEDELSSATKADMEPKVKMYQNLRPVQPSEAGNAMVDLQEYLPSAAQRLIGFLGRKTEPEWALSDTIKDYMARLVLFDYIAKERMLYNGMANEDKILAGPVEKAFNEEEITPASLARSPEFNKILGKLTPARVEAFLSGDESRRGLFNSAVQKAAAPVKVEPQAKQAGKQPQQPAPKKSQGFGMGGK